MPVFSKHLFVFLILLFPLFVKAQSVFITPSGAKYHLATCRMVKNVSKEITLEEAQQRGLNACNICHPQATSTNVINHKAKGDDTKSVQCIGLTKAGTRCKHLTRIANGLCYQHQK